MLIRKEEKWGCGGRYPRRFVCAWRLGPVSKIGSWQLMTRCWSCQGSPSSWMAFLRVPQRSPGGFTGNWAVHTGIPSKIGVFPTNLCIAESLVSWLQYKLTVCTSLHPGVPTSTPHPLSSVTGIWNHHTNWKGMFTYHCGLEWVWGSFRPGGGPHLLQIWDYQHRSDFGEWVPSSLRTEAQRGTVTCPRSHNRNRILDA